MVNHKKTFLGLLILAIIGGIMYMNKYPAETEQQPEALISFSPYPVTIADKTEVHVNVSTQKMGVQSTPVTLAFAKFEVHFDKDLLELSDEPVPAQELGQVISVTSKDDANQTGKIDITIGLQPGAIKPRPDFALATLFFVSKVKRETESFLTIPKESIQLVELKGKEFSVSVNEGKVKTSD
jgi:hypothetical protein